jgi:hypothetical protein
MPYRYVVAIVAVVAAATVRLAFLQVLGTSFGFLTFYPAVMLAALYGGPRAGLLATVVSAILTKYFWMEPVRQLFLMEAGDLLGLAMFLISCAMISYITEVMHRAQFRAREAETQSLIIAERERSADALREREELLRLFIEHAPAALAMFDREMHYLSVSRRWLSDYHLGDRDLLGVSHYEVFPEIPKVWKEAYLRGLTGEVLQAEAERFERTDGSLQWVRWEIRPWYNAAGKVGGIMIFSEDITERKEVEETLHESMRSKHEKATELAAVLEAVPAAVWIAHDPDCRHITGNRAANELLRQPTGAEASLTAPAGQQPTHFCATKEGRELGGDELPLQMAARGQDVLDFEYSVVFDDGTIRHLLGNATPLRDNHGQLRGSVSAFVDITLRKQAEEKLQKSKHLLEQRVLKRTKELRKKDHLLIQQSHLAAMGEMINNIAHQWRQPLNTLGLNIQQLRLFYDMDKFSEELLYKSVEDAMTLVNHMSRTIDDFRQFFKPDKERVDFEVKQVVADTIKLVEASFKNSQISIDVNCTADPVILGYPNEYAQVILNLLTNAKDAFHERKNNNARVLVTLSEEDNQSLLTVSDNAGGIPEKIIHKIFNPHFTTKGPQGTGIGLFMAKSIIERNMHGKLTVINTNEGAEFRIEV